MEAHSQPALTEREVWIRAATVLAAHDDEAARLIAEELHELLNKGDTGEMVGWARVAAAIDAIVAARAQ